ncbi:MAG: CNNM domain-containing protein [Candidatus Marinimicrobia bacterium]|nr:CNNM domain-containing protein [Candidatus Neomarinimicrobiota bacterium]MCF7850137.1 CNNM domain-containing protein [Candidatus Neomarinimicrobiota bacterium]
MFNMMSKKVFIRFIALLIPVLSFAAASAPSADQAATPEHAALLLVLFVGLALGISFTCSIAEAVLLSITPSYIQIRQDKNPKWGKVLHRLRVAQVDRSLAAILTMNTIAHTVGAIEAGVQSAVIFGSNWVGLFSAAMTLAILFLSEIIPKTLGTVYWPSLVGVTATYIRSLIVLLFPLVLASELITRLITKGRPVQHFSRDEFIAMAGVGEKTGDIEKHESLILQNLFRLQSLKATDIMTPRTVMFTLPHDMSIVEAQPAIENSAFSRIPIVDGGIDEIKGFVLKDEILAAGLNDTEQSLADLQRELMAVPDALHLPALLKLLLDERHHIVLLVDEYGGTKGLVSLEDVMETLLGTEIVDELDHVTDMQALARQQGARQIKDRGLDPPEE